MSGHIEIVKVQRPIRVEIDMDRLTWGDALKLQQYRAKAVSGEMSDEEATQLLNQLIQTVTGQDPLALPSAAVAKIVEALFEDKSNGAAEAGEEPDLGNSASG